MNRPERTATVIAEPEPPAGTDVAPDPAAPSKRHLRSRFDEIVTPHPIVAFFFRRRTFIVLLGLVAMVPWARPKLGMLAAGVVLALLAEGLRVWAAGTIHKTEQLTTGGPYAFVRHPLYVGSFLHAVAYSLMSGRWESFAFVVPLFGIVYGAAVSTEEAMLRKLYGVEYEEYSRRVPRFFPQMGRVSPGHGTFSWRQVWLNREWVNFLWMGVFFAIYFALLFRDS